MNANPRPNGTLFWAIYGRGTRFERVGTGRSLITERHAEHTTTTLACFDRIVITGTQIDIGHAQSMAATLTVRAAHWRWSSLWRRERGEAQTPPRLCDGPVEMPRRWVERVNAAVTLREHEALQASLRRGRPFGDPAWQARMANRPGAVADVASARPPAEGGGQDVKMYLSLVCGF